jgi:hypothetical protein
MKPLLSLIAIVVLFQGDEWDKANRDLVRLAPSSFKQLPKELVQELDRRLCTVPQAWSVREPHNVIRGEFLKKGQIDWVVLCSQNMVSTILVFPGGSPLNPTRLAEGPDRNILQGVGPGQIGYSRMISPVGSKYILDHYRAYGGPKPPPIDHLGIDDAFLEKASVVHYYYQGKWLQLTGAD